MVCQILGINVNQAKFKIKLWQKKEQKILKLVTIKPYIVSEESFLKLKSKGRERVIMVQSELEYSRRLW